MFAPWREKTEKKNTFACRSLARKYLFLGIRMCFRNLTWSKHFLLITGYFFSNTHRIILRRLKESFFLFFVRCNFCDMGICTFWMNRKRRGYILTKHLEVICYYTMLIYLISLILGASFFLFKQTKNINFRVHYLKIT